MATPQEIEAEWMRYSAQVSAIKKLSNRPDNPNEWANWLVEVRERVDNYERFLLHWCPTNC